MNFTCILVLRTLKTQAFIPLRSYWSRPVLKRRLFLNYLRKPSSCP
jgi:hypothetical protein